MKKEPIAWKHARPLARLLLPALWLLPLFLAQACKDPDRPKPDEKFYCKVDGKAWRPNNDGDFKVHSLLADLSEKGKYMSLNAYDATTDETMLLSIVDTSGIDENSIGNVYELSLNHLFPANPPSALLSRPTAKNSLKYVEYATSAAHKGTFRILDIEKDDRLVASIRVRGTFEFEAVSPSGKVVKVTDGQFNGEVRILQ